MKKRDHLEKIYSSTRPEDIPWISETPPDALIELMETNKVSKGRAIDLGCGTGHYAIWLAGRGFAVTGIDVSPSAIQEARRNAADREVSCEFLVADILDGLSDLEAAFDFAYSWHLLHHIYPEERPAYAAHVHKLLRPGGKHLSVCFSEQDPQFGGQGKYRETRIETVLYFSSEDEIGELFAPNFRIEELKTIETEGKAAPHRSVWALMTKL